MQRNKKCDHEKKHIQNIQWKKQATETAWESDQMSHLTKLQSNHYKC